MHLRSFSAEDLIFFKPRATPDTSIIYIIYHIFIHTYILDITYIIEDIYIYIFLNPLLMSCRILFIIVKCLFIHEKLLHEYACHQSEGK